MCQQTAPKLPIVQTSTQEPNLKFTGSRKGTSAFWRRQCCLHALCRVERLSPCKGKGILHARASLRKPFCTAAFQAQNIALRKRTRDRKREEVEAQIADAVEADRKGLTHLYKCMNTLRPKQPKRSIHITGPEGRLQSDQAELASVCAYFQDIFSSSTPKVQMAWHLQGALNFSLEEIRSALRRLSAKKALPVGQAPALLWQSGEDNIVNIIHQDWAIRFQPRQLEFPPAWHETHTVLIPKPGKPPTSPSNLRPISLLPAIPKTLARIAADRLKPFLEEAAFNMPQFAYLTKRQTLDSIDRVAAHCVNIRIRIAENRHNPFRTRARASFTGGMQLSLDMAKAFDRMPRTLLLRSLERTHAPADLIVLIMFIHDNACMKFQRNQHSQVIHTGSGIRQGCGLAPLLWAAYSLLLFSTMLRYLNVDQLTGFADDLHMQWSFDQPRQFKNACAQVGFILRDLRQAGMQVSSDKTVSLLALSGQSYGPEIKPFLRKTKSGRCLKVHDGQQEVLLPIKQQHTYLGVVIGYQHFERATMKHRLQLSWQAFHRLHTFLCSKKLEVGQRLRLWRAGVLSIATYGLTAIGLDEVSASKLRSHVHRQLRIITGNPAHLTHETNASLAQRYSAQDPVHDLYQRALRRVEQSRLTLLHLQNTTVQQRWSQLLSDFATHSENNRGEKGNLTEVTQVVRIQRSCNACGQQFGSFHALRTHVGKAHPEMSVALTKSSYPERSARKDEYIKHSVDGRPHSKHCQKQFSSWPAYMSHFNKGACPVLHMLPTEATSPAASSLAHGTHASETDAAEDDSVPIFHRSDNIAIAKQGLLTPLATHVRGLCKQSYCPECGVKCKTPMYVSRHATKLHASIKEANQAIIDWARNSQVPANPCTWCGERYSTQAKAHRNACPVLWACGHLLNRHSSKLRPPGQTTLRDDHSSQ